MIAGSNGVSKMRGGQCHTPSKSERRLVEAVADEAVASFVAVRHRSTTYLAAKVPGEQEAAVFGTDGREIRAVNEVARDASSAEFDFLYGTGEVLVIKGDTSAQEGRERAIARVGACALGAATNR